MNTQGRSDVTPEELAERLSILTLREFTPPEMRSTAHTGLALLGDGPRRERLRAREAENNSDRAHNPLVFSAK